MKRIPAEQEHTLLPLKHLKEACKSCNLRELCVSAGITPADMDKLDSLVSTRTTLTRGEVLYTQGDPFVALFAIRRGFFKTTISVEDGREQILGFQVPGELLGFDGVASDHHVVNTVALEDSEVCVLSYAELERISGEFKPLQQQLHKVMSKEIVRDNNIMLLLGSMNADERIAAFLLNLSERYRKLGYAHDEFILRMTRQEIGSFLGLKLETVSRGFSRLQALNIVDVKGKKIRLLDMSLLRQRVFTSNE